MHPPWPLAHSRRLDGIPSLTLQWCQAPLGKLSEGRAWWGSPVLPGKVEINLWKNEPMVGSGHRGEDSASEENTCRMLRSEPRSCPQDIIPGPWIKGSRDTMLWDQRMAVRAPCWRYGTQRSLAGHQNTQSSVTLTLPSRSFSEEGECASLFLSLQHSSFSSSPSSSPRIESVFLYRKLHLLLKTKDLCPKQSLGLVRCVNR